MNLAKISMCRLLALTASAVATVLASTTSIAVPTYVAVPIGLNNAGFGINSGGQIIGTEEYAQTVTATVYTGSSGVGLGALGGLYSYGGGINRFGHATGSASVGGAFDQRAFLYANGQMVNLGSFAPGAISYGRAINDSDQVTGVSYTGVEFIQHAFLYSGGVMVNLGASDGGDSVGN